MVLILSSLLTAEISGGFWNKLPVKVPKTFFKLISLSIGPWSLTIPIYYLPADCWDLTKRVALKSLINNLPLKTDDKTSSNFRIQSTWVTGLLDSKDSLDPSDNFVRTWVWWFIQIDATILQIFFQWSFEWGWTGWDWSVMIGKNVHFVVVFKQEWPFRGVHGGILIGRFDKELLLSFNFFFDFFLNELFVLFLIFAHEVVDINFYGKWLYLF